MIRQLRHQISSLPPVAVGVMVVLAIGVLLRIYKLDAQSFWYDEGNSARIAERSLQLIIAGAAGDIHPPLYYLILHYWRALFGESEVALRSFSAVCGALLVGCAYLIGRTALTPRTGLLAAALAAASPFAVYYSQEARMYILLALLAGVSSWALLRLAQANGRWRWYVAAYILATVAGLYSQYAYPFVMIAQSVGVVIWLAGNGNGRATVPYERAEEGNIEEGNTGVGNARRSVPVDGGAGNGRATVPYNVRAAVIGLAVYAGMNLAAIAAFLPWLPIAIRQITAWTVAPQDYSLGGAMLDAYRWLIVGRTLPLEQAWPAIGAISVLALIGSVAGLRRAGWLRLATVGLLLLALLPFGLLFVFKLYREAYLKFLLVCVTPLFVLAAHGLEVVSDAVAGRLRNGGRRREILSAVLAVMLTLVVIAGAMLPSLHNLYDNPAYARDDYRGIARMLESQAQPGDAILLNAPNQWEVFTYYYRSGAPVIPLTYRPTYGSVVDRQMTPIAGQYARLFVLYYGDNESDPGARFEHWLAGHAYKADEQWLGNIRLAAYATRPPAQTLPITATFGEHITLLTATVELGQFSPGSILPLRLAWSTDAKLAQRYKVFVHLGPANAAPVAQNDSEPVAGVRPTDTWNPGEAVVDQRGVWIKSGVPAGTYGLYVGLYDSISGQRLQVHAVSSSETRDRLWLGDVIVD